LINFNSIFNQFLLIVCEWHYSNVIAIKCESLLPTEFVLLAVDRTIEHRTYENLKRLFCSEIDEREQTKKFPIIRFQRKY
jgi:hypothetical protein